MLEKSKKNDIMDNVKALCKRELKIKYFIQKKGLIMVELNLKNIYKKYPIATTIQWKTSI